jgi:hypothetical protein
MLSKGSHRYAPFEPVHRLRAHHFGAVFAVATPAHPATGVAQWQPMVAKAASTFALPEA